MARANYHRRRRAGALTVGSLRGALYTSARILGDYQAVRTGHVGRRVARRSAGRLTGRMLRRLLG